MKPLNNFDNLSVRPEIVRLKQKIGMFYGIMAGLAFAIASWGWDGYMLSKSHAYYPWTMFITGTIFCILLGGMVGWITARFERSFLGVVFWTISSVFFAWLMVALPLQINPFIASKFDPQLGALLNYGKNNDFAFRFGVSLIWVIPFLLIIGITQLPIMESAVFSTSIFGKIAPFLFCIVVMSICGTITDNLINAHFREAITSLDNTIQFVLDNKSNHNIDQALSREVHAGALNSIKEYVRESRHLFVGSYDENLGNLHVLVKFTDQWADCNILYSQPVFCKITTGK